MSDILKVKVGNSWVGIPSVKGAAGTAEVQEDSITVDDLSPDLRNELGLEKEIKDRTFDLSSYAIAKLAKWANGTVTYPSSGCNCVEFKFVLADIRPYIPTGLTNSINLFFFGMNSSATYHVKFKVDHGGTVYTPNVNTTRTGKWLIPDYSDCDIVYMYMFLQSGSVSATDIPTYRNDMITKAYDMVYYENTGVTCSGWITPAYGINELAIRVYDFGDETVKVKIIEHLLDGSSQLDSNSLGVFDSNFTIVSQMKVAMSNVSGNTDYIRFTSSWDRNINPLTYSAVAVLIPANPSISFFYIKNKYVTSETTVTANRRPDDYILSAADEAHIRNLYPFLGKYCGTFDRLINSNGSGWFSNTFSPSTTKTSHSYVDILQNGEDGDWYIYRSKSDLLIKNQEATWGDIIYRKSSTVFLPLDNPTKFGNYETIPEATYDIVIVGGGAGGIGAAYALRNSGLKVMIADKMKGLGGTHTQAGLTSLIGSPIGDWFKPVCKEASRCGAMVFHTYVKNYDYSAYGQSTSWENHWAATQATVPKGGMDVMMWFNKNWFIKRYHDDITDGGIEIRYQRKFLRHNDVNGTITSLVFLNLNTGAEEKVYAKYVIDCTGDIYVGRYNRTLDTDFYLGTDPYSRFNEPATVNISTGDPYGINTVEILYRHGDYGGGRNRGYFSFPNTDEYADQSKDFPAFSPPGLDDKLNVYLDVPPFVDPGEATSNPIDNSSTFPYVYHTVSPDRYCGITKQMFIDYGEEKVHEIADRYARAHYRIDKKTSERYYMGIFPLLAIRESYRMNCEYMCTQSDVEDIITTENYQEKNIVALSSWYADIHGSTSVQVGEIANTSRNGIPYLAMVPVSYKNLLIACRGYGASHLGLSGMRLIKTMMGLGRAAGMAAKQCVENGLYDTRDVDVSQVQTDAGVGELLTYLEEVVYPVLFPTEEEETT